MGGSSGGANSGNGGQGIQPSSTAGSGGSGLVFVSTPSVSVPGSAPGVWDLNAVYSNRINGTWPT